MYHIRPANMSMTQTFFAKKRGKDSLQLIVEMDQSSMQINSGGAATGLRLEVIR